MRILFVNPLAGLGGSERSLLDVMLSLRAVRPDIETRLLLFEEGELAEVARELGIDVIVEPLPEALREFGEAGRSGALLRGADLLRALWRAPRFVAAVRHRVNRVAPDIVHTNGMKAHLLAVLLRDRQLVVHLRDFVSERPVSRRLLRALPRRTIVVTNSHAVAEDLRKIAPELHSEVVYNAIDLRAFEPGPSDPNRLPRLAGMTPAEPGTLSVGLVGTYAWWKGHLDFIAAARRVQKALPAAKVRFYVVGGSIYATRGSDITRAELERAVRRESLEGVVGIVPFQSDAPSVYRGLDIVVHASTRPEPFGRIIVEAMASGKPVVVSRAGGACELFDEGHSGLGFTPGDPDDLARAIVRLVSDAELRAALGRAGRQTALERFDRSRLGREVSAIYDRLIARP
jgi:glycosyltransferase involved in cell wall biosynthesis